jgi:hypothetical protein
MHGTPSRLERSSIRLDMNTGQQMHNQGEANDRDSTPFRDPEHWKTGDEPMTAAQRSYLQTLATEAGEELDEGEDLTKAQAALRIEELQERTGRGGPAKQG